MPLFSISPYNLIDPHPWDKLRDFFGHFRRVKAFYYLRGLASSETWGDMYRHGELAKASLTITLEEYT